VCPAKGEADLLAAFCQRCVAAISIDLQDTCKIAERSFCQLALAVGRKD
jgi:hypothetical protein